MAILLVTGVLTLCLTAAPAAAKNRFYAGFGFGFGQAYSEDDEEIFDDADDTGLPGTFHLGLGGVVSPFVHIGFDLTTWYQEAEYDYPVYDDDMEVQLTNWLLAFTVFPFVKGAYVKTGIGIATAWYDYFGEDGASTGYSVLVGAGYLFPIGPVFNMGVCVDYSRQWFDDDDFADDTSFWNVYLALYWF